ncbi:MAG TPA: hypothetical protein VKB48_17235 [Candidatus Acidoferrum sp.]|nr:hypothetical protein [Candidatus Acidoferrum sp.]
MRITGYKSALISTGVILAIAVLLSAAPKPPYSLPQSSATSANEIALTFEPSQTKVHDILDATMEP